VRSRLKERRLELDVGGSPISVVVRESHRATRLRMVVRPGRPLEVTVPRRTARTALLRFLDDNSDWLAEKIAAARQASARVPVLGLEQPGVVWAGGRPLEVVPGMGSRAVAVRRGDALHVSGPYAQAPAAIERWYRREARSRLEQAVEQEATRLGVSYERIAIRDQRSRWGSCSSRGTLSFNWRLILAPADVLDYVVVHELLHVQEANHSAAFWRLLDFHRPGWREQADWLRVHGRELLDYRFAAAG
jgi:predicted metal-dependent hydrolase